MVIKWPEKNFLKMILIFSKKYDIVYNSYTDVKTHLKSNCKFFFEKNVHFEVGFFLVIKWPEKNFLKMILIFSKKYDIVYNSYTDVKTHLKSNCKFFFEKNVHFEVGFFLVIKWPEKNFLKMILIFSKKYDIVYNSYTDVKTHLKSNCKFFFEKNVHFEVGFFLVIKWPEKNFLKMILIFSKKYDIVYNSYTDVKTHLKSNCKFFFEKNVHFEVGFFLVIKWPEKNFLKMILIFSKKYDIVYNSYTDVKTHLKSNCKFFFEKNVHFEVGFFLVIKWPEKNFLKMILIFSKKYAIVYNSYTDVKTHLKSNCKFFFEKNVHFEVGFFLVIKWPEKNFLKMILIFSKKYDIVYNSYTDVKTHLKSNCKFFFEKNVHFEVGFFLVIKWPEKNFLKMILIFSKKYDIVYNSYTDVKTHLKSNCKFFFEKNVHFEVGFFLVIKWPEKNFLKMILIFSKKYDIVYNSYTDVKTHLKSNCKFFFEKNVHFEVGFFLVIKWPEKNFLKMILIFSKKYDIVYNSYTDVKTHLKSNCKFFFEKNVHFEVGFFLVIKWPEKNFLKMILIFSKKYDIVYNSYTDVKTHLKSNCKFFFEKNVHFEVGFFLVIKWPEKNFLKMILIFSKKYDIVYNSYTDVKTHLKSNCKFFFEKNVHFEVGFFLVIKWPEKNFLKMILIFSKKYDIVYNSYTDVKTHLKSNCKFFFEKNVHFEVGFFLVIKWPEKNFLKMILIFSKKYDIVYNSYTDVKTHLKSNCKFFFEKNVHFEVGFFLVIKWPEKNFLKMILIFSKKYDIVYNSYTDVKTHLKSNCKFFFEKNVHFEVGFFLVIKWPEKNFLKMILIFSKKYDIVYNSYTDVKTHLKSNCKFFFEKNVHFEVGFFLVIKWPEKNFLKMILIFSKKYDIVYNSYTDVKTHLKSNCKFFFEKNVHFEVGFFLVARKKFLKNKKMSILRSDFFWL